ncbi:PilZ domain-containing protein [Permianibacter sp. IMCC34836]|uniref:PilZ domain-containing protein n=1 Tax=Permianibacter fluminis TaxID=2738515 RepID=UPI001557927C|nr:PilZ domain-containing protein [Permianibacter fluminis]NQD38942.1 PilZ domain-containing protein [Permianibacter fluminis]
MADIKPPAPRKPMVDPLEAKRLEQPCLRTIDLRPERGKRCRAYPHGGRTHWLDDAAIAAFEQAMVDFKGRYTIGVYERTLASNAAQPAVPTLSNREPNAGSEEAIRRIPFGYRPHRHESRLNFVSAINIELDSDKPGGNKTVAGKTLDLSLLGVRVQIAASDDIPTNSNVLVHYHELQQRADEPLGSIAYTVLGTDRDGDKKLLRLKRVMRATEHVFDAFVPSFIEHQLARYKMELKDALPATYARIYERLYSQRAWFAEAFFALDQERPELLFVTTAADWQREQDLQVLPQIAARLAAGASSADWQQQQQATSHTALHYWLRTERGDYLLPASALTPLRRADWQTLAAHAVAVASTGQRQKPLDAGQIEQALELLPDELAPTVLAWQQRLQRQQYGLAIVPLGPLPNPAHMLAPEWLREYALIPSALTPNALTPNTLTSERQKQPTELAPLTALGLRGARAQERFRYRTPMLLHTEDGREFAGESLDFSINGLGLELHNDIGLTPREWLRVSFPVLQQKVKEPEELADQPYRVVRQLGRRLTLERDFRVVGHRAARFFAHIIQQNRGRLPVCHNERQETAESQLSEQVLVRGLIGCPLFVARDQDKHPQLLALGHHHGSEPGAPFNGPQGAAVLAALADLPVLYDLLAGICNSVGAVEKVAFHKLLLMPASTTTPARWQVLPRATSNDNLTAFLNQGGQLFQLILTPVPSLPRRELDDALLPILGNSRHRANEFRSELSRLVGIATLFDISPAAKTALAQNLPL